MMHSPAQALSQAAELTEYLQRLSHETPVLTQRTLVSNAMEEVITCIEELETADEYLLSANEALEHARSTAEVQMQRYFELFHSAPCGYLVTSANGVIREANLACEILLGIRCDRLIGKPIILFFAESERATFYQRLSHSEAGEQPVNWSATLRPRRGDPFPVQVQISAYRDPMGTAVELRWTVAMTPLSSASPFRDTQAAKVAPEASAESFRIAELEAENWRLAQENAELRKQAKERQRTLDGVVTRVHKLEKSVARKQELARESHTTYIASARYLDRTCLEPLKNVHLEVQALHKSLSFMLPKDEVRLIETVSRHIGEIVFRLEAVGTLAMVSSQTVNPSPIETAKVVEELLQSYKADCEKRSLEIQMGRLPKCVADHAMFREILRHLLSNALKFTCLQPEACIEIGCLEEKMAKVWYVRDNGIGFRKEDEHLLFRPFHQLHRGAGFEGAGIGLAVVKQLVLKHGGRVWAEGAQGKGTTICFTLSEETKARGPAADDISAAG